ncbi:hypothetical protein A9K72_32400 [Mesorhizobium loti]|uniref:hypothetical protein n=1 Tax=Mesorhizobium jarvisii TaxID=1777867 RepID=UPI0007ECCC91|nr:MULTISPECIES: hypothetical protein [Mesorhizobium]OBQ71165.1 hypothetical protein A9K72_32400 [Mesorhizobium loti]
MAPGQHEKKTISIPVPTADSWSISAIYARSSTMKNLGINRWIPKTARQSLCSRASEDSDLVGAGNQQICHKLQTDGNQKPEP